MRWSVAWIAVGLLGALAGCSGGGGNSEGNRTAAPSGRQVTDLTRGPNFGFDESVDGEGNRVMNTEGKVLYDTTQSMDFDEANLMATGNAARYQDAEYQGNKNSNFADRESRYSTQTSNLGGQESRFADNRNRWNESRYGDAGRNYSTGDYQGPMSQIDSPRSHFEGQANRNSDAGYAEGNDAFANPDIPEVIRNIGQGGFIGNEQTRALTSGGAAP